MMVAEVISWCCAMVSLTFRPRSAPVSLGTVPSFIRLFSKIRPIRRSPSLDGCHVTGCYEVRVTTHLVFHNKSVAHTSQNVQVHVVEESRGGRGVRERERKRWPEREIEGGRQSRWFHCNSDYTKLLIYHSFSSAGWDKKKSLGLNKQS